MIERKNKLISFQDFFLNPFFLFSFAWIVIIAISFLPWSNFYKTPSLVTIGFIGSCCIFSIFLGFFFDLLIVKKIKRFFISFRPLTLCLISLLIFFSFLSNFIYAKQIPALWVLFYRDYAYGSFSPIKTLYPFTMFFNAFFGTFSAFCFCRVKSGKKMRFEALICFLFSVANDLLCLDRGQASFLILMFLLLILATFKIHWWQYVLLFFGGLLLLFLFGVLGNIRSNLSWNDNSLIDSLVGTTGKYPSWIPKQYLWSYIYLVSPICNLDNIIASVTPERNLSSLLINFLPDFISNRVSFFDKQLPLIKNYFTVCTGFGLSFKFGGTLGMFLEFFYLSFLIFLVGIFSNNFQKTTALVLCDGMAILFFFVNTLNYSAFSFPVVFCIAFSLLSFLGKRFQNFSSHRLIRSFIHVNYVLGGK